MSATSGSCSHCGKQGVALKRCARCLETSYCGAECQKAAWKGGHKMACMPPLLPPGEVFDKVKAAYAGGDWKEVIKWQGRLDDLLEGRSDVVCNNILFAFSVAHRETASETASALHQMVTIEQQYIEVLGKMERFRDQGESCCKVGEMLTKLHQQYLETTSQEAARYLQQGRDVGAAHGFFSVECRACLGLGQLALLDGRLEEGADFFRNAVAAAPLNEDESSGYQLAAIASLVGELFRKNAIDEVEPLVLRFREAAQAESRRVGSLCSVEFQSLISSARLHEARGRPQEAERELRALLNLMRENQAFPPTHRTAQRELRALIDLMRQNQACNPMDSSSEAVQSLHPDGQDELRKAIFSLKILDPEHAAKELMIAVATELCLELMLAVAAELVKLRKLQNKFRPIPGLPPIPKPG
ncbi:hypothetical protein T484DRAFT_1820172 [Baffinella frigidus]|nr:hypothetical protein T484DRAFT_1820172 [Cryptophyta sp. CCMP2293]